MDEMDIFSRFDSWDFWIYCKIFVGFLCILTESWQGYPGRAIIRDTSPFLGGEISIITLWQTGHVNWSLNSGK